MNISFCVDRFHYLHSFLLFLPTMQRLCFLKRRSYLVFLCTVRCRNVNLSQNLSEHFLWWNDIVVTSWVGLTQKTEILTENSGARGAGILHKWRRYSFLEFLQLKCWFMCIDEVFWCNPTSFKAMGLVHFEKRRQKSARYWKKRRRSGFLALSGQKYKKKCTKYVYEHNPNSADNIGLVLY